MNAIFFGSFHSSTLSGMFYKIGLLKNFGKLCLDKVAHHQADNFIKKRLQHRCFTVKFAKLLETSDFNLTFLTLRPRKTYIYVFPELLFLYIFLSHFMIFIEAPNKFIWFYSKFWVKQAIFDVLMYWFSAAQQTSSVTLPDFFPDILNRSEYSKGEWN